jgi:hypothetical protein
MIEEGLEHSLLRFRPSALSFRLSPPSPLCGEDRPDFRRLDDLLV